MDLDQGPCCRCWKQYANADPADRNKQPTGTTCQALIDAELTAMIGADPHQRTASRINQFNGSRPRVLCASTVDV
ncbi:transposase [Mycobacterium marinum]|nr:transposase [Mycobacterium marinum]